VVASVQTRRGSETVAFRAAISFSGIGRHVHRAAECLAATDSSASLIRPNTDAARSRIAASVKRWSGNPKVTLAATLAIPSSARANARRPSASSTMA
jgi:hypothetical protein